MGQSLGRCLAHRFGGAEKALKGRFAFKAGLQCVLGLRVKGKPPAAGAFSPLDP